MFTPRSSLSIQGVKRTRTESPGTNGSALSDAVNLLVTDDKLPAHLKTILVGRIHLLLNLLLVLICVHLFIVVRRERLRSVVVIGIEESKDPSSLNRIAHDAECIRKLFDFLSIDCTPITSYRMGKPNEKSPRLIKVVLPSRYFRRVLLERAPRLKTYQTGGVYIRPSLPKAERDRLRAIREEKKRLATITSSNEVDANDMTVTSPMNVSPLNAVDVHDGIVSCDRKRKKGGGVLLLVKQSFCPTLVFSESVADGYEIVAADFFSL
ncbi:hypothetical protein OSTOST_11362 [Ostertagia ostertagi]